DMSRRTKFDPMNPAPPVMRIVRCSLIKWSARLSLKVRSRAPQLRGIDWDQSEHSGQSRRSCKVAGLQRAANGIKLARILIGEVGRPVVIIDDQIHINPREIVAFL